MGLITKTKVTTPSFAEQLGKIKEQFKVAHENASNLHNTINRLKEDNKLLIDKYEKAIKDITESKDDDIKALQDRIAELSKSKEEKIAELMATINEAQSKLEKLSGTKKKGLFNKIFG